MPSTKRFQHVIETPEPGEWELSGYEAAMPITEKSNPLTWDLDKADAGKIVQLLGQCDAEIFQEKGQGMPAYQLTQAHPLDTEKKDAFPISASASALPDHFSWFGNSESPFSFHCNLHPPFLASDFHLLPAATVQRISSDHHAASGRESAGSAEGARWGAGGAEWRGHLWMDDIPHVGVAPAIALMCFHSLH
ncbi:uncharacterized protein LOC110347979 isoform X2 [Heterocephalus glaber]|uniref:Uncharacterized protein LOC110347979 isoform X2 n=1 Tax=Heterocephalus glaber TaxID=10181 RepID=A0AAX6SKX8_HETGA|nr:uncharacterized protein LOC110347979 isoform X2 [Heterocephalus glaber]